LEARWKVVEGDDFEGEGGGGLHNDIEPLLDIWRLLLRSSFDDDEEEEDDVLLYVWEIVIPEVWVVGSEEDIVVNDIDECDVVVWKSFIFITQTGSSSCFNIVV